jgi:hypothetical protein
MITNELLPADLREWPIAMLRVAPPPEVEELSGLDWDTIERHHADKIIHLSPRRIGMRVGHALTLSV